MLAGVQLSDGLKLEAIADGGFSYAEIPYEIIEKMNSRHIRRKREIRGYLRFRDFPILFQS